MFVCLFVCLFVKRAYAREETCASSSFAGTCMPSNSAKRHKEREKQQKTRASSSFAGYSTRFRGKFSLFLARKTLENDFTHWNIVQMKIFKGFIHGLVEVKGGYSFSGWNSIFSLFKERFCSFRPYFSIPQKQFFSVSALFLFPPKHQYIIHEIPSQRRAINNKRGNIDNSYIKRKLRIKREEATRKTRRNNAQTQKNVGDNSKNLQRFSRNLPRFLRKAQRFS